MAVAVAIIGGIAWYLNHRHDNAKDASASGSGASGGSGKGSDSGRVVPVQVANAERKDMPIWLEGLGTVAAFQQVTVHTLVDGRLDKVLFTEGQVVKAGDVIAQVDPRPFMVMLHNAEGALARDRAQHDSYQRDYERDVELFKQNLLAKMAVDDQLGLVGQSEGAMKIDQAAVESARLQLDYAQIKAPLEGITGVRLVDAGNIVHATDPNGLVVITAINPAAVLFTVPQDKLPAIASAIARGPVPVEIYSRDGSKLIAKGQVAVLDNQINATTATLRLKALVPNADRVLWPNAFVKAQMLLETRANAIVVPAVAIQQGPQTTGSTNGSAGSGAGSGSDSFTSTSFVYVVRDGKAQMVPVVVALMTGDSAVIDAGLKGGEQVVIEGQNQLRPGTKVTTGSGQSGKPDGATGASAHKGSGSGAPHTKSRGSAAGPTASSETPATP